MKNPIFYDWYLLKFSMNNQADVQLSQSLEDGDNQPDQVLLIDSFSSFMLYSTLSFLTIFVLSRFLTIRTNKDDCLMRKSVYELNSTNETHTLNVEIALRSITQRHSNISLMVSLIRRNSFMKERLNAQFGCRVIYSNNKKSVKSYFPSLTDQIVDFMKNEKESSKFELFRAEKVDDFDEIDVHISSYGNLSIVSSIVFYWTYNNALSERYFAYSKIVLAILSVVLSFAYIFNENSADNMFPVMYSSIGALSFYISFPFYSYFGHTVFIDISNIVLRGILVSYVRGFCVMGLLSFIYKGSTIIILSIAFLILYCIFEVQTSFQEYFNSKSAHIFSDLLSIFNLVYIFLAIVLVIGSYRAIQKSQRNRWVFYTAIGFICIFLVMTLQESWIYSYRVHKYPTGVWGSIHVIIAIFILFSMQTSGQNTYGSIESPESLQEFDSVIGFIDQESLSLESSEE